MTNDAVLRRVAFQQESTMMRTNSTNPRSGIATRLVNAGHPPTLLEVEQEDLEHYFLRLVGLEGENVK